MRNSPSADAGGPPKWPDATKLELILAAERIFSESGINAASLRAISSAAGQKNISCVQYHFGDRIGLLQAILQYREGQLEPIRKKMLEDYHKNGSGEDVKDLLGILFLPYGQLVMESGSIHYIKLMLLYLMDIRPHGLALHPADDGHPTCMSLVEAREILQQKLAYLDEAQLQSRTEATGAMFYGALIQTSTRHLNQPAKVQNLLDDTIAMMAAAISLRVETGPSGALNCG